MTTDKTKNFFRVSAKDLKKIPGSPIAYWIPKEIRTMLADKETCGSKYDIGNGLSTSDNERFLRFFWEVSQNCIANIVTDKKKWFFFQKGGAFRRWFGNLEYVVDWENNGAKIKYWVTHNPADPNTTSWSRRIFNTNLYFKKGFSWSVISSGKISFRLTDEHSMISNAAAGIFNVDEEDFNLIFSGINTNLWGRILSILNPTVNYSSGIIQKAPLPKLRSIPKLHALECVEISRADWDSYETSWDFQTNPLLTVGNRLNSGGNQFDLSAIYIALRRDWQRQTEEMRRLEIENNRIFIDAYGLQDELSPEVPWNEITLTCNPWYRYGKNIENFDAVCNDFVLGKKERIEILPVNNNESDERPAEAFPFSKETEERLLEDTIKEFISYAVGCMMGRYSPEKPGLILANQGESFDDYASTLAGIKIHFQRESIPLNSPENFAKVREYLKDATWYGAVTDESGKKYSLIADRDGVIPILDEEWFVDDIVAQFKQFLRFTFGKEHFADNLDFIEKALGKDLRKYFIKDFYKDHVQRYKKRPIYWMFSSPKGSFNALIYMHRYRPDTVSIVLNEYLREFISKIRAKREHLIGDNNRTTLSPAEKTRNLKQIDKYAAMLTELDAYERDILYPLAQEKIAIDLDDGVKVNYVKFGAALKKIPGLEAKEE